MWLGWLRWLLRLCGWWCSPSRLLLKFGLIIMLGVCGLMWGGCSRLCGILGVV